MKFQAQRIREIESELVGLHLTCAEVVRVMSEQGPLPETSPMLAPARQLGKLGMRHVALACGAQPRSTAGPMRSPLDLLKAGLPIFGALAWDESKPARAFARLPSLGQSGAKGRRGKRKPKAGERGTPGSRLHWCHPGALEPWSAAWAARRRCQDLRGTQPEEPQIYHDLAGRGPQGELRTISGRTRISQQALITEG